MPIERETKTIENLAKEISFALAQELESRSISADNAVKYIHRFFVLVKNEQLPEIESLTNEITTKRI